MDKRDIVIQTFNALRMNGIVKTQKDFANLLGCNEASISRALKGDEKYLTDGLVQKVKAYLDENISATPGEWVKDFPALDSVKVRGGESILVIPTGARAGTLGDFADAVKDYDYERMISPIKGADFAIQVTGESMSPEYPNGSQIIIKKISAYFISWGNVFCLDTNDGAIIKQVFPTEDADVVECRSLNPAFPPFRVRKDLINGWYRVLMCLSLK